MGHFHNPPPCPIAGATAAQPYAQGKLPPALITVPNPPFINADKNPQSTLWQQAAIGQPDPWVYGFQRDNSGQPYAGGKLPPSLIIVPNPPFINADKTPTAIWQMAAIGQPDPWVFDLNANNAGQPYAGTKLPPSQIVVPNPPFINANKNPQAISEIVQLWQPDPWVYSVQSQDSSQPYAQGKLSPGTPGQSIDNPPFATRKIDAYPVVDTPIQPPRTYVVVTAQGPYANVWLATVVQSWFAADPAPTQPRYLPASQLIVPNPPFPGVTNLPNILVGWQPPDPPPTLPRNLSPGIPGQSVDNPPRLVRKTDFYPVADPIIQPPRYYPQAPVVVVAQNPYFETWLSAVLSSWIPIDPLPTLPRNLSPGIPGQSVDNPPIGFHWQSPVYPSAPIFISGVVGVPQGSAAAVVTQGPYANVWLATVVQSWFGADPAPTQPRYLPASQLIVPNPPFPGVTNLPNILVGWQPPDPFPTQPRYLPASQLIVPNPPFPGVTQLPNILAEWQPPDPPPALPRNLSPGIPGQSVDNPPLLFRRTDPYPVADPPIQPPKYFVQPAAVVVAQNPFVESWLSAVLQSWQPNDPQPTLPRTTAAIPGWSVDNPPGAEGNLIISWLPPDNQPTLPRNLNPSITAVPVNNPPFTHQSRTAWIADLIVRSWQPPDPLPTLGGKLPPSITAVRVDNPPFSSRSELPGILAQWAAWPPQPLPTPSTGAPQVQPGPPPPPVVAQFTVSGPDVSVYLREFFTDVIYTDAPITKRTV